MHEEIRQAKELVDNRDFKGCLNVTLCGDLLVYFPGAFLKNKKLILQQLEATGDWFELTSNSILIDGDGRFRKKKESGTDLIAKWFAASDNERVIYGIDLESRDGCDHVSDRAFQMYCDGGDPGFIRSIMPASDLLSDPAVMINAALSSLKEVDFLSAYGGFGVNFERTYPAALSHTKIAFTSKRFRCIHLGRPLMFAGFTAYGVLSPSWLTGIGEIFVDQLGGIERISDVLPKAVILHDVGKGLLIQVGDQPQLGDVNRGADFELYNAVGNLLSEVKVSSTVLGPYNGIGGTENTAKWLNRFNES